MTTAQTEVRRAARGDHAKVGAALGAAFVDDPVFQWLIPVDVNRRDERLALFFTSMARSYLRRDKHVYCAGDGVGGALWSAPGSWAFPMTEARREARPSTRAFGGPRRRGGAPCCAPCAASCSSSRSTRRTGSTGTSATSASHRRRRVAVSAP